MAPFLPPKAIVNGFKEKVEAINVQGDRLYVGTAIGNLHIYSVDDSAGKRTYDDGETVTLVETKKNLTRRSIDQLGFIKDINSLVILSESVVALYPIPNFSPSTPLVKAKGAFSFAVDTSVQHLLPDGKVEQPADKDFDRTRSIPTLVTQLVVGCRRKVAIYSWRDGEAQEIREAPLPHSPRAIAFLDRNTVCFAYSPTDYVIFSLESLMATDIATPLPISSSVAGMGAFTGLTGYMTLGLGAKSKPGVIRISETEILITKDDEGFIIGPSAKPSKRGPVNWPASPEEIAFVKPYIFSVLPSGSVPEGQTNASESTASQPTFIQSTVIQVHSSLSLLPTQTLPFPFTPAAPTTPPHNSTIRLLTASSSAKSPLFFVSTPTDRAAATAEGSTIWQFCMKPWAEQIDELVYGGQYADALSLLDTIDQAVLPDKDRRRKHIRALNAVSQFSAAKFDDAIDTFIELDLNPAKVVALYPDIVAGRLSVPRDGWIPLYGGPSRPDDSSSASSDESAKDASQKKPVADLLDTLASPTTGSVRDKFKTGLGVFMPSGPKDDDAASVSSKHKPAVHEDDLHSSVETLVRYLSDRRPKVAGALATIHITPAQSHKIPFLSETSVEDLFAQPNEPLSSLTPEQLLRFAQIVDTALYKSFLFIRPRLLGSLCRLPNWCEVSEVEEDLRARENYGELVDLYSGKKMHAKALELLRHLSEKETNMKDKLSPSISYLQKLGPEYLQQVFDSSRWVFEQDHDMAFEIFSSEYVELPRQAVADFLESVDPHICARYLEYLIEERDEEAASFHDRLAELYLSMTLSAKRKGDDKSRQQVYAKLLHFIDTTHHYRIDRLYGILSSEDLFEARAILLGRLGRHDQALELYVYRLQDHMKAEEYCKRVYRPASEHSNVYLTLLRIYLRPTVDTSFDLLEPALELISRHSPRLDAVETLQLLPPLVTAQDVRTFLLEALRAPIFDTRVVRETSKGRTDQLARKLMLLQAKRVKVTDSRICPQCHKRLGNSVIAVHSPRGEVTHYQCREAFSRRLTESRR